MTQQASLSKPSIFHMTESNCYWFDLKHWFLGRGRGGGRGHYVSFILHVEFLTENGCIRPEAEE